MMVLFGSWYKSHTLKFQKRWYWVIKYYIPDDWNWGDTSHRPLLSENGMLPKIPFHSEASCCCNLQSFFRIFFKRMYLRNHALSLRVKTRTFQWYRYWHQLWTSYKIFHYNYLAEFILCQRICAAQHSTWGQVICAVQHSTGLHLVRTTVSAAITPQDTTVLLFTHMDLYIY